MEDRCTPRLAPAHSQYRRGARPALQRGPALVGFGARFLEENTNKRRRRDVRRDLAARAHLSSLRRRLAVFGRLLLLPLSLPAARSAPAYFWYGMGGAESTMRPASLS